MTPASLPASGEPVDPQVVARFQRRKAGFGVIILSWAASLGVLILLRNEEGYVEPLYTRLLMGWMIATTIALYVTWRCPRCRRYLSSNFNVRFCPHCAVRFTDR